MFPTSIGDKPYETGVDHLSCSAGSASNIYRMVTCVSLDIHSWWHVTRAHGSTHTEQAISATTDRLVFRRFAYR